MVVKVVTVVFVLVLLASVAAQCVQAATQSVIVGRVRVSALSPTLLRIEPKGPMGWYDNTSLAVVNRNWPGVPIKVVNQSSNEAWVATSNYQVHVMWSTQPPAPPPPPPPPPPMCSSGRNNTDVDGGARVNEYPNGLTNVTQSQCCSKCASLSDCTAWIFQPSAGNCWLMSSAQGMHSAGDRILGGAVQPAPQPKMIGVNASVFDMSGKLLWQQTDDLGNVDNNVNWPSPLTAGATAIADRPRFYVPPWGPTPIPKNQTVDPALVNTTGYDFRNDVPGDTYVFLLGSSLDDWHASRQEFLQLTGATPLLPDYAGGTWFTYWHSYTQSEAEGEVRRWKTDNLPIDVWGLDMNWRNTSDNQDHYYNHPAVPNLFQSFDTWFQFLANESLKTYFNDHPWPQGMQTSPTEIAFRWNGLTEWMARGLTYWWFDSNWSFSIPPPFVNSTESGMVWEGLSNRPWGAHVYYSIVARYIQENRPGQLPIILNKYAENNEGPSQPQHEHSSHHRYPVHWTGDGVPLIASIESMIDQGVNDFKCYVHSDCGGDYRGTGPDLVRWIQHCSFGTILRIHGSPHQPWSYDNQTEDTIRTYLNMRYAQMPSILAAFQTVTESGFPYVARNDLFYPEYPEASSNHQHFFLNDTLVAPIWDSTNNFTSVPVWIPPGQWQDAWSGEILTGPQNITAGQPYERIPMWHRVGGMVITTSNPGLRVEQQDWSELTVEAWPASWKKERTVRRVYSRETRQPNFVTMETLGNGRMHVDISPDVDGQPRAWVLRFHLRPNQRLQLSADNMELEATVQHIAPLPHFRAKEVVPFKGKGAAPAPGAGPVAEVYLPASAKARSLRADFH